MEKMTFTTDSTTEFGANFCPEEKAVHFKLFSKNATKVILCIFEKPVGEDPVMNLLMTKTQEDIWETSVKTYVLKDLKEPFFYGYRIFGPNWEYEDDFEPNTKIGFKARIDNKGNRFNPNKLAFDPYSKELSHIPSDTCPDMTIYRSSEEDFYKDNAKLAPKSVFFTDNKRQITKAPLRPFSEEIIGEVHIKDLTQNLPIEEKGTYLGAAKFAWEVKKMGITTIEFLPLQEFDYREDGQNYWGYMTLNFFSPARKYAFNKEYSKSLDEFRTMIDEFHKSGIKVCMDVVYNHTGEARIHYHKNQDATLLSYALIDNSEYYKLCRNKIDNQMYYRANSGCHNDTYTQNKSIKTLVADSIAFWAKQGVDAFRFDLAASLLDISQDEDPIYDSCTSLCAQLTCELEKRGVKVISDPNEAQEGIMLIAEPWTCGGKDCYQLGNFPKNWLEWNDVSRDTIRRAALFPSHINLNDVRNIIEGTKNKFENDFKAINYISCHDGFSLYDLNSFSEPNETTTGGSKHELCSNNDNDDDKKENSIKKELALLFLSKGVPMLQAGDLIMHTKGGNNNSYNRDDDTNYYDYKKANTKGSFQNRIYTFAKSLIELRKTSKVFTQRDFEKYLTYYNEHSQILDDKSENFWFDYSRNYFGIRIENGGNDLFIAFSKHPFEYKAKLPDAQEGKNWYILFDTSNKEHITFEPKEFFGLEYILNTNSIVVFRQM